MIKTETKSLDNIKVTFQLNLCNFDLLGQGWKFFRGIFQKDSHVAAFKENRLQNLTFSRGSFKNYPVSLQSRIQVWEWKKKH